MWVLVGLVVWFGGGLLVGGLVLCVGLVDGLRVSLTGEVEVGWGWEVAACWVWGELGVRGLG